MHGNVWQWTDTADGEYRVVRGGGWGAAATFCQAGFRYRDAPTFRFGDLGFRLARVSVR
jgi:formylglycine-generating enzyme required for sulfatase activity